MKVLVTASLALWGAVVVSGCDGGGGPVSPFNPFGDDPSGSISEPGAGSNETPPRGQGTQSIAQLCADVCAKITTTCPSYTPTDCASGCAQATAQYPQCAAVFQAFLLCASTTTITCSGTKAQAPDCTSSESALVSCESGSSTTVTGGTGGTTGTIYY